jgi:hypothetical protein
MQEQLSLLATAATSWPGGLTREQFELLWRMSTKQRRLDSIMWLDVPMLIVAVLEQEGLIEADTANWAKFMTVKKTYTFTLVTWYYKISYRGWLLVQCGKEPGYLIP